jgi:hypothetical protein
MAMKFVVGSSVGGPATVKPDSAAAEGYLAELVAIEGVASIFITANFVTVSKLASSEWDDIVAQVVPILEREFGG